MFKMNPVEILVVVVVILVIGAFGFMVIKNPVTQEDIYNHHLAGHVAHIACVQGTEHQQSSHEDIYQCCLTVTGKLYTKEGERYQRLSEIFLKGCQGYETPPMPRASYPM